MEEEEGVEGERRRWEEVSEVSWGGLGGRKGVAGVCGRGEGEGVEGGVMEEGVEERDERAGTVTSGVRRMGMDWESWWERWTSAP